MQKSPAIFMRFEVGLEIMKGEEGRTLRGENFGGADCAELVFGNGREVDLMVQNI